MRLRACLSGLLLLCGGCMQLPTTARLEVDGHSVEFKKPAPPEPDDDRGS
jgi:hypothetical protein